MFGFSMLVVRMTIIQLTYAVSCAENNTGQISKYEKEKEYSKDCGGGGWDLKEEIS